MNTLLLVKNLFTLRFVKPATLPLFVGNTIRGAFGQSLCDNYHDTYDAIFKQGSSSALSFPNPFVISAPYPSKESYKTGDELTFSITLFGSACRYEEDVKSAVSLMCNGKLDGAELIGFEHVYSREWSDEGAESIPYCDSIEVFFLTPTEIRHAKNSVEKPDFKTFITALFGRISGIIDNYTSKLFTIPYCLVIAQPKVTTEYKTQTIGFTTSGQPITGFTGSVKYYGDITGYLPYIDLGSQIHIGKKTTRSCGEYKILVLFILLSLYYTNYAAILPF